MANREHLAKLKKGVETWNNWRSRHAEITPGLTEEDLIDPDLRAANFNGMNLIGADLDWTDLRNAQFRGAILRRINCRSANLCEADFSGADLSGADFRGADLSRADLSEANLTAVQFADANLSEICLSNAYVDRTVFGNNDLSVVKGLETTRHVGPSTIGIDTIFRSKGQIPDSFLRGCGVPEDFIIYKNSLATNPIEFYSCFISYSTKDQDFADRLYADLQKMRVRSWFAPHDVKAGEKLHQQIDDAIRLHDKLLLILSPHSMQSEWVKTEIAKARKREVRDNRRILFPIRLAPFETLRDWECFDADAGKDSAREIREYFIPDFSNWTNPDSYEEAFRRLIADLKSRESTAS